MTRRLAASASLALVAVLLVAGGACRAQDARLEAAKKEGKVVWYTSLALPSAEKVAKLFEAAYPGIKVEVHRTGSQRILQRVMQELQANIKNVDVCTPPTPATSCCSRTRSCSRSTRRQASTSFPAGFKDKDGYYYGLRATVNVDRLQHQGACPPPRRRRPGRTCSIRSGRASW